MLKKSCFSLLLSSHNKNLSTMEKSQLDKQTVILAVLVLPRSEKLSLI